MTHDPSTPSTPSSPRERNDYRPWFQTSSLAEFAERVPTFSDHELEVLLFDIADAIRGCSARADDTAHTPEARARARNAREFYFRKRHLIEREHLCRRGPSTPEKAKGPVAAEPSTRSPEMKL